MNGETVHTGYVGRDAIIANIEAVYKNNDDLAARVRELFTENASLIAGSKNLLACALAYLKSLRLGSNEMFEQGVRSPAFQSRTDETIACLRALKAAAMECQGEVAKNEGGAS